MVYERFVKEFKTCMSKKFKGFKLEDEIDTTKNKI